MSKCPGQVKAQFERVKVNTICFSNQASDHFHCDYLSCVKPNEYWILKKLKSDTVCICIYNKMWVLGGLLTLLWFVPCIWYSALSPVLWLFLLFTKIIASEALSTFFIFLLSYCINTDVTFWHVLCIKLN